MPKFCEVRELTKSEIQDVRNSRFVGVKCFYFQLTHINGQMDFIGKRFADFALVPRIQLNKYLDRIRYEKFVHFL